MNWDIRRNRRRREWYYRNARVTDEFLLDQPNSVILQFQEFGALNNADLDEMRKVALQDRTPSFAFARVIALRLKRFRHCTLFRWLARRRRRRRSPFKRRFT